MRSFIAIAEYYRRLLFEAPKSANDLLLRFKIGDMVEVLGADSSRCQSHSAWCPSPSRAPRVRLATLLNVASLLLPNQSACWKPPVRTWPGDPCLLLLMTGPAP